MLIGVLDRLKLPLVAAALLFFQAYLPIGTIPLNVNLADPIAVAALLAVLTSYGLKWRHQDVIFVGLCCAAVMTLGLLIGFWYVGVTKWALLQ